MSQHQRAEFERLILPHAGAAYSLARWLMRQPHDAEDAAQEAMLRAYRAFDGYQGGSPSAWLLVIVRNTCLTLLERRRADRNVVVLSDVVHELELARHQNAATAHQLPDEAVITDEERRRVHAAIQALPVAFREVLVLREFHELSYREIAEVVGVPAGTVMSRLARARERLAVLLAGSQGTESEKNKDA